MSSFTDKLVVTPSDNGDEWLVYTPFEYHVGDESSNDVIYIEKGFQTDLASMPWIGKVFGFSPHGRYSQAAVVHDKLCKERKRSSVETHAIFLEMMQVLKVGKRKRKIMNHMVTRYGPKW